jgi:hypothetical protein
VLPILFLKIKSSTFNQQSGFQTKDLWLSFVLNVFDFISRAKFLLKFNLALIEKGIPSDLLNKNHCEKFLFSNLSKKKQQNDLTRFKRKCFCC